ncbi:MULTISPECIES: site-specific integrase [unclassified Ruegeria]|uniref:tyrosine-type recombinase/integrase n=1 Tax=unclassified Ruegeria TaxID=2625375 RepID=UPI0020C394FB|nr:MULTISPECIES: site-specific integrase [unclassified Ruegeria]
MTKRMLGIMVGKRKGQHPQNALKAPFVRSAKGPALYADGNGLYLKVDASGARRWIQRLMIRGKRREIAIGSVSLVSLSSAREAALDNRRTARAGGDPTAEKRRAEEIPTFEKAAREAHEANKKSWRNAKHAQIYLSSLETYAFPHFGNVSVAEVDGGQVLAALLPIWTTKDDTARRVRQRISTVFKWAIAKGWRTDNPAETVKAVLPKQNRSKRTNRKSLPYQEVSECVVSVRNSSAEPGTKLAVEFLIHTAARSIEVREAVWSEIDFDKNVWAVPAERMKMAAGHRVPLTGRAVEILRESRKLHQGDLVFPGRIHKKPLSDATLLKLVRGLGYGCDIHGFRASFRTWAQEQTNFPREVCEMALAHKVGDDTEKAYARSDMFEKRRLLMDAWASYLALKGGEIIKMAGQV